MQERTLERKEVEQRRRRLRDVRNKLIGPVRRSVEQLQKHLAELLDHSKEGFVRNEGRYLGDNKGVASAYKFCLYFFWQWQLKQSIRFETVTGEDYWQCVTEYAALFAFRTYTRLNPFILTLDRHLQGMRWTRRFLMCRVASPTWTTTLRLRE